jgi:hypothetical protein
MPALFYIEHIYMPTLIYLELRSYNISENELESFQHQLILNFSVGELLK